jgi:hypothetical protein
MSRTTIRRVLPLFFLPACALTVTAEGYRLPPQEVVEIVTAAPAPSVSFSPDHRFKVYAYGKAMPSIEELSRPMLRLAGMRIDPATGGRFRTSYPCASISRRARGWPD